MSTKLEKFGRRLREIREKKGMTQEELAFKSDLSVYHISKIERGKSNPSLLTLISIADALDLRISRLLDSI